MALTKCNECGADISDKAPSCPKCGSKYPFKKREIHIDCPECSAKILQGAVTCPNCGFPLEEVSSKSLDNTDNNKNDDKQVEGETSPKKVENKPIVLKKFFQRHPKKIVSIVVLIACCIFFVFWAKAKLEYIYSREGMLEAIMENVEVIKEIEEVDVVFAEFAAYGCEEKYWYCESKVKDEILQGILEGIKLTKEKHTNVTLVGRLVKERNQEFYNKLKSEYSDMFRRRNWFDKTLEQFKGNTILFGLYKGDNNNLTIKSYIYSMERSMLVSSDKTGNNIILKRSSPNMSGEIAESIRTFLIKCLE